MDSLKCFCHCTLFPRNADGRWLPTATSASDLADASDVPGPRIYDVYTVDGEGSRIEDISADRITIEAIDEDGDANRNEQES